jgi:hypothetical protein
MKRKLNILMGITACLLLGAGAARAADGAAPTPDDVCSMTAPGALGAGDFAELARAAALPVPVPQTPAYKTPVVITVPGLRFREIGWGPLEFRTFMDLSRRIFGDKKTRASDAAVKAALAEYNAQFDPLAEAGALLPAEETTRAADSYLEDRLLQEPACAKLTVVPFRWTRDPSDTEATVARFIPQFEKVYDTYKGSGRPIYILSHSWGTVIMHEVLQTLSKKRPDIRVDKFITLGSPLVPGNVIIRLFKKMEVKKEHLQAAVTKPANVRYWKNVWASRDPFSNGINAADVNVQVDEVEGAPESKLTSLIMYGTGIRMQAKSDLVSVLNVRMWHKSYFVDFKAYLKTIDQDINVVVFPRHVAMPLAGQPD